MDTFVFAVGIEGRDYILRAPNEEEFNAWKRGLKALLAHAKVKYPFLALDFLLLHKVSQRGATDSKFRYSSGRRANQFQIPSKLLNCERP